jgi:hypothetical protein
MSSSLERLMDLCAVDVKKASDEHRITDCTCHLGNPPCGHCTDRRTPGGMNIGPVLPPMEEEDYHVFHQWGGAALYDAHEDSWIAIEADALPLIIEQLQLILDAETGVHNKPSAKDQQDELIRIVGETTDRFERRMREPMERLTCLENVPEHKPGPQVTCEPNWLHDWE